MSLQEQRAAIERHAERHHIQIVEWFEERITAAKSGRPLFDRMLRRLRKGDADGVIIHKIDRSARNLRDWAELGELIDAGVVVHFANESVDLSSRGGRLSADIQAVVAADYIRNLREETLKGIYGRLKQGLYPFAAPVGYLDTGSGNVKEVDPARAPLVRQAFELYASGSYTYDTLVPELRRRGLTTRSGTTLSRRSVADILHNSFYTGIIRIKRTGQTFEGKHTPIVPTSLFRAVQSRLSKRIRSTKWTHDFLFRGLFQCSLCGRMMTGETRKGHVYYRCHTPTCPTTGFREEALEAALLDSWPDLAETEEEIAQLRSAFDDFLTRSREGKNAFVADLKMQLAASTDRHSRLVDAFVDGLLDKETFESRKAALLHTQHDLEEQIRGGDEPSADTDTFELALSARRLYSVADTASKRELALRMSSSRTVAGKSISVQLHPVLAHVKSFRPDRAAAALDRVSPDSHAA